MVAAHGVGRILDKAGNSGSEEKGGGKDVREDAADARLIACQDGQHPCSLFVVGFLPAAGFAPPAGCAPTRASVIRSASQSDAGRRSLQPSTYRPLSSLRLSIARHSLPSTLLNPSLLLPPLRFSLSAQIPAAKLDFSAHDPFI